MNIHFNSEGSLVIPKEKIAPLLRAVNAKNFYQAELEFSTHWKALGEKLSENSGGTQRKSFFRHSRIDIREEWFMETMRKINEALERDKHSPAGNAFGEMRDSYKSWMKGDVLKMSGKSKRLSTKTIIRIIIIEYLNLLRTHNLSLRKLALDVSGNNVVAWIEIQDNDQEAKHTLSDVESTINARFFADTKIFFISVIMEQSNAIEPPEYFIPVSR